MTSIGKYQVLDELGRGSAGITYRARDRFLGRELALKVLYAGDEGGAGEQELFHRELAACAELRHPNILRIYDAGEADGAIYIAAELLTGADLKRQLRQAAALPPGEKIEWMAQVCDGLAYAHRHGITHGNLKPANIFLTSEKRPVLLDLGLSNGPRLGAQAQDAEYRSPEQIARQGFDARADVFSAAVVAYELVVDAHPFPGGTNDIQNAAPRPPRTYDPRIPAVLEALLLRALEKDPQRRLQTAEELGAGLRAAAKELQYAQTMADVFSEETPRVAPSPAAAAPELIYPPPPAHDTAFAPPALISTASPRFTPVDSALASGAPVLREPAAASSAAPTPAVSGQVPSGSDTLARQVLSEMRQMASVDATYSMAASDLETRLTHLTGSHAAAPPGPAAMPIQEPLAQTAAPALSRLRRIALLATAALVALAIGLGIVAHQKTQASQAPPAARITQVPQVNTPAIVPPSVQQNALTELPPAAAAVQSAPAAAPEKTPAERILRVQVNSLYQTGRYTQALKLVDGILAEEPDNTQARAWKQRIRAAQDAEAAFK